MSSTLDNFIIIHFIIIINIIIIITISVSIGIGVNIIVILFSECVYSVAPKIWWLLKYSQIGFDGAETICRIAHTLDILLEVISVQVCLIFQQYDSRMYSCSNGI